uniref:Anaphase-promoting complex subunit 4 WD40 domain-containing protein n=2 Tax=Heterosigma akashiwo TaxID=2829 RepID=A0A7S4D6J4_HETAK
MCACTTTLRATSSCNAADVAPDGAAVLTGHQDGGLRFWDVRSGAKVNDIKSLHQSQITSVMYSPDNASTILTNSRDNTLKLVDARTYEVITTMSHPSYRTSYNWSRTTFSPNGAYAAAGSGDGSVFVFDVYDGSVKTILTHHRSAVSSCYWSSSQLMSCDREGFLTLWS